MFNYGNIGWQHYRTSAQGYQVSTSYFRLYTSYRYLSYQLPSLIGNRGRPEANKLRNWRDVLCI